ncbi:MAG: response regulator [Anaerolineales bacterium]|nr:response regulator [Anaerolineales bacterium]
MKYQSRILVVDDQALMREHMQRLLGREGYELAFATNGLEALELVETFSPDLVLLDVRMPEMDGFEVCRRLRANPHTADLPIIMVTAFDDRDARLQGIEVGADDFIPKPYDSIELRARVRTITRLNRYRRMVGERTKFQILAERSANGYLLINDQDQCTFANRQARIYLGLNEDINADIGVSFIELTRKNYQLESKKAWNSWPGWSVDNAPRYLVRPESPEKPALWLQVDTLDYLLSENEMVWVVGLRDVTTQMAFRQDMWKFQRVIHHKMRTPLVGLYTGIQFLADFVDELPKEEIKELIKAALDHGDRLREAVEDVLRYVDTPNLAMQGMGYPLAHLKETIESISTTLELEHIRWQGLENISNETVALSQQPVELVLWELLENSKKFHPDQNPTISVTVEVNKPDTVRIQICDDGAVLTPEDLAQIWSPYYQSEKHFTGEVTGMGLGLPTVASLVWSVGGECRIYNLSAEKGVGVELILPLGSEIVMENSEHEVSNRA